MHLRTAMATTRGSVKQTNEDSCCVLQAETEFGPMALIVVCDGVGGLAAGDLASNHVVQRFARWFQTGLPTYLAYNSPDGVVDVAGLERVWGELLRKANARIRSYAHERGTRMGSTFSGLFLCQDRAFIGQVGDSRVYQLSAGGGSVQALTQDQTLVERELSTGLLTPEEAVNHPKRSVILQAVGSQAALNPVFSTYDVAPGDVFAVCCDGFYHLQDDDELAAMLDQLARTDNDGLARVLQAAISERAARGEHDNITIACCVNGPAPTDDAGTTVLDGDDLATDVLVEDEEPEAAPAPGESESEDEPAPEEPEFVDEDEPTTMLDEDEDEPTPEEPEFVDEPTTMLDEPVDEDEPTTLLDGDDSATDVLVEDEPEAAPEPEPAASEPAPAADDDATTVLPDDAGTTVLDDPGATAPDQDAPTTVLGGEA